LPANFMTDFVRIDQSLPQISFDELHFLKDQLPDMSSHLVVPSPVPIPATSPADYNDDVTNKPYTSIEPASNIGECSHAKSFTQDECKDASLGTSMTAKEIGQLEYAKLDMESCLSEKNQLIEELVSKLNNSEEKYQLKDNLASKWSSLNTKALDMMKSMKANAL